MIEEAMAAARAAGKIQREAFGQQLQVDALEHHDIKLQVDKDSEAAILSHLKQAFPEHAVLAEESGSQGENPYRWIVDPLDGTMNFYYNIPHFCVSIALEVDGTPEVAVVYDPIRDELFSAVRGQGAQRNGQPIRVSPLKTVEEAVVVVGFMKDDTTIQRGMEAVARLVHRARKIRCTGSAALDLAYIAAGRFTAYYEVGIKHWDIAAGRLLVQEAGGMFEAHCPEENTFNVLASNGHTHEALQPELPIH